MSFVSDLTVINGNFGKKIILLDIFQETPGILHGNLYGDTLGYVTGGIGLISVLTREVERLLRQFLFFTVSRYQSSITQQTLN